MVGKQVQQYTFLEKLGAGGMGDVYRAQDTRLNRFVGIKVLSGAGSSDPDRRRRFVQEAQAASALNHPNIITIHDILIDGDAQYMVMEHVQGKTLADLIPKGGLRVPQVLRLALQMTDALQTAHSAGIIHRDLKPGNVMVTDTGLVKILDFGLAKLTDPSPVTQEDDATRTMGPAPLTVEGSIIGTVSYMSPEQAQGKKVDTRSDIFSFGVVLYEMITGARAFQGDTTVGTLSMILRDSPRSIQEISPDVPPRLDAVIAKALMKSPDDRFQTMKDLHAGLSTLKHESDSGVLYRSLVMEPSSIQLPASPPPSAVKEAPPQARPKFPLMIGGAVAAAAVIGGVVWMMSRTPKPAVVPAPIAVAPKPVAPVPADDTLTNDGVIQMIRAKVPVEVIYSQLRTAPKDFNLSAAEVIRLTQAGVPVAVIEGMRDPKSIPVVPLKPAAPKVVPPTGSTPTTTAVIPPVPVPTAPAVPVIATPPPSPRQAQVVLGDGTPFAVALLADVHEDSKPGVALRFAVVNDVRVGEIVVIPKGALATGEITQGKGRLVGKMQMRLSTVTAADGKFYNIRALSSRANRERPVDTGVKAKNKDSAADLGTQYIAYVDGEMNVTVRSR